MNNIMKRYDMGVKYGFIKTESHAFIARILHFFLGKFRKGKPSRCQRPVHAFFLPPQTIILGAAQLEKKHVSVKKKLEYIERNQNDKLLFLFLHGWGSLTWFYLYAHSLYQHPQSRKKSIFWRSQTFHYLKFWTFVFWCHRCLSRLQNSTFGLG